MTKKKWTRRDILELGSAAGGAALLGGVLHEREARAGEGTGRDEGLPQVPRRTLGMTGESIPILLMGGSMKFDVRFDPKLAECLRFGVNYFDVADCYAGGTSEVAVGNFLKRTQKRKEVWITSKSDRHDPKGFEETVSESLQKIGTDYIDLYFLHALQDADALNKDLLKKVEELKKSGRIRHFGFSCHHGNVVELLNKAASLGWVEAIMFRYNYRQYGNSELNKAIDACAKAKVGLIAMKTQGSEASFAESWKKFEKTGKWNKYQAVLKAVWADERIAAAVSQMDTFDKLKENIAAAVDRSKLGAADWDQLKKYAESTRSLACDGCDHLCSAAVDAPVQIGTTLRYLMYHDVYGEEEKALELFRKLPPAAQRLSGVDFSPANSACPHRVDVAKHLARAARIFQA